MKILRIILGIMVITGIQVISLQALSLVVTNNTSEALTFNSQDEDFKRFYNRHDLKVFEGDSTVPGSPETVKDLTQALRPGETVTFILIRVGNAVPFTREDFNLCLQKPHAVSLFKETNLKAMNIDVHNIGWNSFIEAGEDEYFFASSLGIAHIDIQSHDKIVLKQTQGGMRLIQYCPFEQLRHPAKSVASTFSMPSDLKDRLKKISIKFQTFAQPYKEDDKPDQEVLLSGEQIKQLGSEFLFNIIQLFPEDYEGTEELPLENYESKILNTVLSWTGAASKDISIQAKNEAQKLTFEELLSILQLIDLLKIDVHKIANSAFRQLSSKTLCELYDFVRGLHPQSKISSVSKDVENEFVRVMPHLEKILQETLKNRQTWKESKIESIVDPTLAYHGYAISSDGTMAVLAPHSVADHLILLHKDVNNTWHITHELPVLKFPVTTEIEKLKQGPIESISISDDKKTIVALKNNKILIWQNSQYWEFKDFISIPQEFTVISIAISPDGQEILGGTKTNGILRFEKDTKSGWHLADHIGAEHSQEITAVTFTNKKDTILSGGNSVDLWQKINNEWTKISFPKNPARITALGASKGLKTIISGSEDGTFKIWYSNSPNYWQFHIIPLNKELLRSSFITISDDENFIRVITQTNKLITYTQESTTSYCQEIMN